MQTPNQIKVSFVMDRQLYSEIQKELKIISSQLDMKLTMPLFLKRTILENWKIQVERFHKLNRNLKTRKQKSLEGSTQSSTGSNESAQSSKAG